MLERLKIFYRNLRNRTKLFIELVRCESMEDMRYAADEYLSKAKDFDFEFAIGVKETLERLEERQGQMG